MDTTEKVKSRWTRSFFTALNTRGDEERYVCDICQKDFASPSNLTLHSQVHVIERKFKCEPCQVSFHSQGHLQKHKRSSAHETRVEMTQAFGIPTSDNPRPYGCPECDTAFRKHGHLAKHLRSKSHITKLESNGLIPVGTYAALEKCGQDLKDKLVTTNCEQSLQSLRQIAMHIFHQQPIPNEPSPVGSNQQPSASSISVHPPAMGTQTFFTTTSPSPLNIQPPAVSVPSVIPSQLPHHHPHHPLHHQAQQQHHHLAHQQHPHHTGQNLHSMGMNMMTHQVQAHSLDYTLPPPPPAQPPQTVPVSMISDQYSHLNMNLDNTKYQSPQPQHYPQAHQHHQVPAVTSSYQTGYSTAHVDPQMAPMPLAPTVPMNFGPNGGINCPTTIGSTYMRH